MTHMHTEECVFNITNILLKSKRICLFPLIQRCCFRPGVYIYDTFGSSIIDINDAIFSLNS